MTKIAYIVRSTPAGNPVSGETVVVEDIVGSTTLDTLTTDASGIAIYEQDGSPGPIAAHATVGARTVRRDGRSLDQMGTWFPNDAPKLWRTLGNGVIPGYTDPDIEPEDMQVTPGTGLQVLVGEGVVIVDGHLYACSSSTAISIDANSSGSTRYDRIVVRFTREGQAAEGRCVIVVLKGTPGAGDAPALTKSDATFEFSLGKLTVINGASSFVSGDIQDERYSTTLNQAYVFTNPNAWDNASTSFRSGDILYVNNAGKLVRLPKGTDGQVMRLASGLPAWASQTIVVADISDLTATATELNYTDGVTSAIQSQLDNKAASSHTHNASAITAGTVDIARLPVGTSSSQVAVGDHTHTEYLVNNDGGFNAAWSSGVLVIDADIQASGVLEALNALSLAGGAKLRIPEIGLMPAVSLGSAAGSGGTPSASIIRGGSDTAGTIRIATGTGGVGTGVICTVTFQQARSSTEYAVLVTGQSTASGIGLYVGGISTGGFDIRCANAPGINATVDIAFLVIDLV